MLCRSPKPAARGRVHSPKEQRGQTQNRAKEQSTPCERNSMAKQEITWNLSELFPALTDPSVEQAIRDASPLAEAFESKYRGKISGASPSLLLECIREFEAFEAKLQDITLYAGLAFAANMALPETQALYDKVSKLEARLGKQLAFFAL